MVFLVKRPTLSYLCNRVTVCNVFRAALKPYCGDSCGFVLTAESIMPIFLKKIFYQKMHFFTLHHLRNNTDTLRQNTLGILCTVIHIYMMRFLHLLPFAPKWWYYFIMTMSLTAQTTHTFFSRTSSAWAFLAIMAASLLVAHRGQWGDSLGISGHR